MNGRRWCLLVWVVNGLLATAPGSAQDSMQPLEVRLAMRDVAAGRELCRQLGEDLARTPRRHELQCVVARDFAPPSEVERTLAVLEVDFDPALRNPRVELARSDDELSPGWLVHAVLRAGSAVKVETDVVDSWSSCLGQLVHRSSSRREPGAADSALALGIPALRLVVPSADATAVRLLAATLRRLDGLDGYPLFEDEFLVAGGRVLLRRDLYWLGLVLWLALFWRGRGHPGREFRWLLLAAWLVAPVYASLLLALPAVVATLRPAARWPAVGALLPVAVFGILLAMAVSGPRSLVLSVLPALLVVLALAAFGWHYLVNLISRQTEGDAASATTSDDAS